MYCFYIYIYLCSVYIYIYVPYINIYIYYIYICSSPDAHACAWFTVCPIKWCAAHFGTFTLEQPSTSLIFQHPRMQALFRRVRVARMVIRGFTWMSWIKSPVKEKEEHSRLGKICRPSIKSENRPKYWNKAGDRPNFERSCFSHDTSTYIPMQVTQCWVFASASF